MENEEYQASENEDQDTERYNRKSHYEDRRGGGYRNDYNRNDRGGGYRSDYNRNDRGGGGYRSDYNRNDRGGGYRNDYNRNDRGGGYRNDYNRNDRGGGYRSDYNRNDRGGGYRNDYNRNDRGGGYRSDYNRNDRGGGGYRSDYNRNDRGGGGYRNDYNRNDRGGGYRNDYNRNDRGGYRKDYNRNDRGGYRGGGGGGYRPRPQQEAYKPRPRPKAIFIEDSQFLLPDHDLNQEFQRAIGMTRGVITDVDPRKKRGTIEIDGHSYKFEDERKRDYQRKYPIEKFKDREIQFAFWPTYSQKAAQYRKIDESPTIKIANLRRTLPEANFVEIIGEVMMVEENLFVVSIFSKSQKKKYLVTIIGSIEAETGDLIQMFGKLVEGGIHYDSHRLIPIGDEAVAAREKAKAEKAEQAENGDGAEEEEAEAV